MARTKNQHFVPQSYLERFTNEQGKIFVFDKVNKRSYETHVRNIASQTGYYDLSDELYEEIKSSVAAMPESELTSEKKRKLLDPQIIEHELAEMESKFAALLSEVIDTVETKGSFTEEQRGELAYFLARQMLRVPEFRITHIERLNKAINEISQMAVAMKFGVSDIDRVQVSLDEKHVSYEHARMMYTPEVLYTYVGVLLQHIWHIGLVTSAQLMPLYTSDNPVIMRSHLNEATFGIGSVGIEIMFPLSPRHVLILNDRRLFAPFAYLDRKSTPLTAENIMYYNSGQVLQSYRQIYSQRSQFELAVNVCAKNPQICDPSRERIEVRSGLTGLCQGTKDAANARVTNYTDGQD